MAPVFESAPDYFHYQTIAGCIKHNILYQTREDKMLIYHQDITTYFEQSWQIP